MSLTIQAEEPEKNNTLGYDISGKELSLNVHSAKATGWLSAHVLSFFGAHVRLEQQGFATNSSEVKVMCYT